MVRNLVILAILLGTIILLLDGRVPKKSCDMFLRTQWGMATSLRMSLEGVPRRPTQEEANHLRTAIRVCEPFTSRFDLVDRLSDDEVYGSISLITLAVELDDPEVLADLVAKGHPIDGLPNWADVTTLHFAASRRAEHSFEWLLENDVDATRQDIDGSSALTYLLHDPHHRLESIPALIEAGVDVQAGRAKGWTPLALAVRAGRFDSAAVLIEAGADAAAAKLFLLEMAENTPDEAAATEIRERAKLLENFGKDKVGCRQRTNQDMI